jgi:hypothetical protein
LISHQNIEWPFMELEESVRQVTKKIDPFLSIHLIRKLVPIIILIQEH